MIVMKNETIPDGPGGGSATDKEKLPGKLNIIELGARWWKSRDQRTQSLDWAPPNERDVETSDKRVDPLLQTNADDGILVTASIATCSSYRAVKRVRVSWYQKQPQCLVQP